MAPSCLFFIQWSGFMKIGYDAKRVFFNETGLGNYSRNLLHGLKKDFPDHEYLLYTPPLQNKSAVQKRLKEFSGFDIKTPKSLTARVFSSWWRYRKIVSELLADQVELYHGLSHELPLGIEKTPIVSVVTVHDLIFLRHPELYRSYEAAVYKKKYSESILRADHVIAISENTRADLVKFLGIDPGRIELIYQCADPLFYEKKSPDEISALLQKYKISTPYLLYVGSLSERKNLLKLIEAFSLLGAQQELPTLVFAGRGSSYRKKMEEEIKSLGLLQKTLFLEGVPTQDLPGLYQGASIFVYPSVYEGFGIPVIESFFSQTPVICSKESCFQETAGDGGFFVDVKNASEIARAMETLLKSPEVARQHAMRGHSYVQKFHQKKCSAEMESFYRKVSGIKRLT